jgi:hypothetical protein
LQRERERDEWLQTSKLINMNKKPEEEIEIGTMRDFPSCFGEIGVQVADSFLFLQVGPTAFVTQHESHFFPIVCLPCQYVLFVCKSPT